MKCLSILISALCGIFLALVPADLLSRPAAPPSVCSAGCGCGDSCPCSSQPSLDREVIRPSVKISTSDGTGSGTVLSIGGKVLILTANHVVVAPERLIIRIGEEGKINSGPVPFAPVTVISRAGKVDSSRQAIPVWLSQEEDLALLKPSDDKGLVTAHQVEKDPDPQPGETCWYCGTGGGLPFNLVRSIVNQMHPADGLIVNGEGWFGHSGSGVFLRRGDKWVLSAVLTHGVYDGPKTPAGCVPWVTVNRFLRSFKEKKE